MKYDKKKYEDLIQNSILFEIDKEKQGAKYRKESMKMVEHLYCYLMAVNAEKYEPYSCEIVEVATRCINGYDRSSVFLHYFNAAWKKEYAHICGNEILEDKFQGMKISEQEKRGIKKCMRLLNRCSQNLSEEQKYSRIAEWMEISVDKVRQLFQMSDTKIQGGVKTNSEGEEVEVFDQIADDFCVESYFDGLASLVEILDSIEVAYTDLQERQKPIVSDMLTAKMEENLYEIEKISGNYSFLSKEVCELIKGTGRIPSQREIAEKYGKNEASVSRTMKEFLSKVKRRRYEL